MSNKNDLLVNLKKEFSKLQMLQKEDKSILNYLPQELKLAIQEAKGVLNSNTIVYDDAIAATDDVADQFIPMSNEEGENDFYVTISINFKVKAFYIFDSDGKLIDTQSLINVFPIDLEHNFAKMELSTGVYYVSVVGATKKESSSQKITYIKSVEPTMLYTTIVTVEDSIENLADDLPKLKEVTRQKMNKFKEAYDTYANNYADYLSENLLTFLNSTTNSPGLSVGKDFINKLVLGSASDRAGLLLEKVGGRAFVEKAVAGGITGVATAIGATVGNAPGAVAGFLVGAAVDVFVNYVIGSFLPSDAEQAIANNQEIVNTYIKTVPKEINALIEKSKGKMRKIIRIDEDLVYITKDSKDLIQIYNIYSHGLDFLKKQKVINGEHLCNSLLKIWLKENAGDDADDGNKYVSDPQWDQNLNNVREDQYIVGGDGGLSNEKDVFIYQFKAEIDRWGFTKKPTNFLASMHQCVEVEESIETIKKEYEQQEFWFDIGTNNNDQDKFMSYLRKTYDKIPGIDDISFESIEKLFPRNVLRLGISLNLSIDENSLFITSFEYHLIDPTNKIIHPNGEVHTATGESWSENIDDGLMK